MSLRSIVISDLMFRLLMIQCSLFLYFSSYSPVPNVSFSHLACGFDVINI